MEKAMGTKTLAVLLVITSLVDAQDIAVPETIHAEGVPPVPAKVYHDLARYQQIRSAAFHGWDSRGAGIYITTRFAEVPQVHWVKEPGGARTQLTFGSERVETVVPRPKRDELLYSMDEGGAENSQFYLQAMSGGEPRRITDGKSRNLGPKWSSSGDLLAWSSNARNGRDMDLYVAAPDDPHFVRRFKEVSGQWVVAEWSPDGTKVLAVEYVSINESYIHIVELASGKSERVTPRGAGKTEQISFTSPRWSKEGRSIYYLTDQRSEFRRLVHHDLDSGNIELISRDISWDVEDFDVSDDGQFIAWVINEAGTDKIVSGTLQGAGLGFNGQLYGLPKGSVSGLKFRPNAHEFGFSLSAAESSADAYSLKLDGPNPGIPIRWTQSEMGGLDRREFSAPTLVEYASFDGRKIPAFVYRPNARKFPGPRPVLIDIHGGPESQFRPSFLDRLNYLVSKLGIALVFPNVRGSSGYGKTYLKLDNGTKREDAVKDVGALFDWISGQSDLDKSRVGVIGGSYGGFMSLAVQTAYNDKIKAGIDIVGISNFVSFLKNTQGYRRDLRRAEYGDEREPEMRSFLERISPLGRAHMIRTPILVVQGQNDPRVPVSEAEQMVAAVKKNGVSLWYVVGKNEGHGFAKKVNQDFLQAVEVMFLRKYLLGEGGDPKAKN
jgi:dipeptidyl aminopeptidase/acylaminoacyl peptidase